MSVCVFVCGSGAAQTERSILTKLSIDDRTDICEVFLLLDYEISKSMTSWRTSCTFSIRHSHGRKFALIFFEIKDKVESCLSLFNIQNQRDRSLTSDNMMDRVL